VERLRPAARQVAAAGWFLAAAGWLLAAAGWLLAAAGWLPRVALLLPLAALLTACATSEEDGDPWPSSDPLAEREQAIGWLDGEAITYGDLARFLRARDALSFSRTLDGLIVDRITRTEAETRRVDVPIALTERRTRTRYLAFETRLRDATKERTGEEIEPRIWLRRTLGLTPEQFQIYLRGQIQVELLQDRLIRYAQYRERSVSVSLIVVEDAQAAQVVQQRLGAGKPFAVVAQELSKHATAKEGGQIDHRMIVADFEDASTAGAVFGAAAGTSLGPFEIQADGRGFFQVYFVHDVREARRIPYAELAPEIEKGLQKRPVSVGEYVHWRRRMQEIHGFLTSVGSDSVR